MGGSSAPKLLEVLRLRIVSGEYRPGEHLTEIGLAEEFGVSRSPVRFALRELGELGLVQVVPNRGAHVAEFSFADIDEIFFLRQLLESRAAAFAAKRRTSSDLARLADLVAKMSALAEGTGADRIEQLHRNNELFHTGVLATARSPRLREVVTRLVASSTTSGSYFAYGQADIEHSHHAHQEILEAIRASAGERAAALMWLHLDSARRLFLVARFGQDSITADDQ